MLFFVIVNMNDVINSLSINLPKCSIFLFLAENETIWQFFLKSDIFRCLPEIYAVFKEHLSRNKSKSVYNFISF